jgi:lysozyme
VSWVYNLGNGNLGASTLLKVLNMGDYAGVPAQMLRWNKAGGKVLEGLTRRRQAEADLFGL